MCGARATDPRAVGSLRIERHSSCQQVEESGPCFLSWSVALRPEAGPRNVCVCLADPKDLSFGLATAVPRQIALRV